MLFIIWVVSVIISASILGRYNKAGTGFMLGFILGPLGLLFSFIIMSSESKKEIKKQHEETIEAIKSANQEPATQGKLIEEKELRECPFCAEEILSKAKLCKHCGKDIEPVNI